MTERPIKQPGVSFTKYARNILSRPNTSGSLGSAAERGQRDHTPVDSTPQEINSDALYRASGSISALAVDPDFRHVVVGGREVLTILSVAKDEILEEYNLREGNRVNLNHSCNDVKWGHGPTSGTIATASSNGSIITWNVDTSARKVNRVISDHTRAVNRLDFNPGNGSWLLSASQDGSMKLWDLREKEGRARFALNGRAEAVRDVQFNQQNALEIAAVHDNGTLQKWDLRNTKIYEKKLNAHHGPALAVNWHTDGRHVVTGGRDKTIKIWDIVSDVRKPIITLHTMAPVARVAWRPGESKSNCQIATCSFSMDSNVILWNLRRPFLPSRVFESHEDVATGILWKDEHTLWSCSKDKTFQQHAVNLAPVPVDSISHYAFGWSNNGDIAVSLGCRASDKYHLAVLEEEAINSRATDLASDTAEQGDILAKEFKSKIGNFLPVQSFAIVDSEEDEYELFRYLATGYSTDSADPATACAQNAAIAYRAQKYKVSKSWKILKLALEQLQRRIRSDAAKAESIKASTVSRPSGDSLLHRDLERLRGTPRLESGRTTIRAQNSPSSSFIMPKYNAMPPLSLPVSATPSRPPTADSLSKVSEALNEASRSSIDEKDQNTAIDSTDTPLSTEGDLTQHSEPKSIQSEDRSMSFGNSLDSNANPWSETYDENSPKMFGSPGSSDSDESSSPARTDEPAGTNTGSVATLQPRGSTSKTIKVDLPPSNTPWSLMNIAHTILEHYRELGDVQMSSTIVLVLANYITPDETQVAEWLHCYVELLHRQKLFTIAAEIINKCDVPSVQAMSETDTMVHTSCARCRKAVPAVREHGRYWMCPRCQNTVQCIVCGMTVRGSGSWCVSCSHMAHASCRRGLLDLKMTSLVSHGSMAAGAGGVGGSTSGGCVAPDCLCTSC